MLDTLRFTAKWIVDPHEIGAVAPSSKGLARAMVQSLKPIEPGETIVELGPGNGIFTRYIRRRYPNNPLLAIEFSDQFKDRFQAEFPDVTWHQGCASKLTEHLADHGIPLERVGGVLSGLPVVSFPDEMKARYFAGLATVLRPGRVYVQFTYMKWVWRRYDMPGLWLKPHAPWVPMNVPPAWALTFVRTRQPIA